MATLTFNGETFTVDYAVKGADFIHGYDTDGTGIVFFDGISDFSAFAYDSSYLEPSECFQEYSNLVRHHEGALKRSDGETLTAADLGMAAANHTHTPASIGAAAADHTHTPASIGAAALDENGKVVASQTSSKERTVTASATLQLTDAGKLLLCQSESAITITVPTHASVAFPIGTELEILQYSTGAVTISPASGVSLLSFEGSGARKLAGQYAVVSLKKLSDNSWLLAGMLE